MAEVDEMKAGREMDALVQELVIGGPQLYNAYLGGGGGGSRETMHRLPYDECEALCLANGMGERPLAVARNYSTDIRAAWAVVEKMRELFRDVTVTSNPFIADNRPWECSVEHVLRDEIIACAEADTAPLAICRAALKAVQSTSAGVGSVRSTSG